MKKTTIRRFFIGCFSFLLSVILFTGHSMVTSLAEDESSGLTAYYKSIQIQSGDSLWKIAGQYKEGGPMTTEEYVRTLKRMNSLHDDTIHAGGYLTIIYYR